MNKTIPYLVTPISNISFTSKTTAQRGKSMRHSASQRAKGRWQILRQAIVQCHNNNSSSNSNNDDGTATENYDDYSIHNFQGYQMIPSPKPFVSAGNDGLSDCADVARDRQEQLTNEFCNSNTDLSNDDSYCIYEYTIPIRIDHGQEHGDQQTLHSVQVEHHNSNNNTHQIRIPQSIRLYTREKCVPTPQQRRRIRSLAELVCHHQKDHIDNTGNICVWDSERTLCWALLHHSSLSLLYPLQQAILCTATAPVSASPPPPPPAFSIPEKKTITIMELGSGMAGLAALCLASAVYAKQQQVYSSTGTNHQFHFCITDGNVDCVQNNQMNVQIMRRIGVLPTNSSDNLTINCCQLLWSLDYNISPCHDENETNNNGRVTADYTLVSDCIHFEHYHGALFWTMVTHTTRQIIMCQPDRHPSWERFMKLVQTVNQSTLTPLLHLSEQRYTEIQRKHDLLMQNDVNYDPEKHRPRIFIMDILRSPTEIDRQSVIQHIQNRS
jgi:Lysine methyltransferase